MYAPPVTMRTLAAALSLFGLALVACSGATTSVDPAGGGGSSSSSGGSDGGSSGDAGGCGQSLSQPEAFCSLVRAKPGVALKLDVNESCGSLGSTTRCEVEVKGTEIVLSLPTERCDTGPGAAVCRRGTFACTIPALAAGQYSIRLQGPPAPPGSGVPERVLGGSLVVEADGTQTSCDLKSGRPPPLEASSFDQACTVDEDCALVRLGDACTACCPNAAIAKTAQASYAAAFADAYAKCELTTPPQPCACAQVKAVCGADQKCKAQP